MWVTLQVELPAGINYPSHGFRLLMRKLVSVFLTLAFLSVVPALAAAELSLPDSCCAPSGDMTMMQMSCCAVASCSMSSQPEPVRTPLHRGTQTDSGQKVQAPEKATSVVSSVLLESPDSDWSSDVLVDPSPPPTTSERLATKSSYLI